MVSLREVPLSGDKLVDWIFKQFVFFLRKETLAVKRKKRLLDPDNLHRRVIRGLMQPQVGPGGHGIEITINSSRSIHCNRDKEAETLIHELSHVVFWKTWERFIGQAENILVEKFTQEQKDFLKSFLPRSESKD
ncbi:MAG: hypothetical protein HYT63_03535 [Candidatus Yanofskybacteria bacterium]|nr:hypothetical protein [Candidatus Yanofskybacteria bacterium]